MSVPLQVLRDGGAQKSELLYGCHSAVHDGDWGECREVSPEDQYHLLFFKCV